MEGSEYLLILIEAFAGPFDQFRFRINSETVDPLDIR
jgi:hypothetical protein